ncbi:hypothetical protein AB0O28_18920 [Microbispora sp. NPDC088329]|uniref:hypothetical protein n=1 Tax=Microbispora sp. NPDC088329 TaxID=3154869 RepID=UPI00341460A0
MAERAMVSLIGDLEPVCTVVIPSRRARHGALARHIEERVRAAFGMPPLGEDGSVYEPPPGTRRIMPGEVTREPRFCKGEIVHKVDGHEYLQVLKIRRAPDGGHEYRTRYYNSLAFLTGEWVPERSLRRFHEWR